MLETQWKVVEQEFLAKVQSGANMPMINESYIFVQRLARVLLIVVVKAPIKDLSQAAKLKVFGTSLSKAIWSIASFNDNLIS